MAQNANAIRQGQAPEHIPKINTALAVEPSRLPNGRNY